MAERVLVIGGSGFIGRRIVAALQAEAAWQIRVASRRPAASGVEIVAADVLDRAALARALDGCDAVVNGVTGSAATIVAGAKSLAAALASSPCHRLVHLSSMAVYGEIDGRIDEATPLGVGGGWYAEAKREAESLLLAAASTHLSVVALRPGCVHGPQSHLWVERFGRWLRSGRLGDLGAAGDGWSNLVHVDDVAQAVVAGLHWQSDGERRTLVANLAAPDSPRWNAYLVALALALDATPAPRIPGWQLKLDSKLAAVPLRVWERLAPKLGVPAHWAPPALPPSLLHLLQQDRRLIADVATNVLGVKWTSFTAGVEQSAAWFRETVA